MSTVAGTVAVAVAGCAQSESEGTADDNSTSADDSGTSTEEEPSVPDDASVSLSVPVAEELSGLYSSCMAFFEAENFTVEEAGDVNEGAGHFHVLINTSQVEPGKAIPSDDQHLHFGDGTEMPEIDASELGTGNHELIIQVANGAHEAYPLATTPITIIVEE